MPRVDTLPRDLIGGLAVKIAGHWYLYCAAIGSLGVKGIVGIWGRRILHPSPVTLNNAVMESDSVMFNGETIYTEARPVRWLGGSDEMVSDPVASGLKDDGSLGAYVGEARMLAKAPKRGKRRK